MPSDLYHRDRLVFLQDQGRRLVAVTGKFHRAVHVTLTSSVAVALGVVAKTSFTGMDAAVFILAWSIAVVLILGVLMFLAQMVARLARSRLANVSLSPTDDDSLKDKGRLRAI